MYVLSAYPRTSPVIGSAFCPPPYVSCWWLKQNLQRTGESQNRQVLKCELPLFGKDINHTNPALSRKLLLTSMHSETVSSINKVVGGCTLYALCSLLVRKVGVTVDDSGLSVAVFAESWFWVLCMKVCRFCPIPKESQRNSTIFLNCLYIYIKGYPRGRCGKNVKKLKFT